MKKVLSFITLMVMVFSISACGNNSGNNNSNSTSSNNQATSSKPSSTSSSKTTLENGSILEVKDNIVSHIYEKDGVKVETIYTFAEDKLESFKMNLSTGANQEGAKEALEIFKSSFEEQGFKVEKNSDTSMTLIPSNEQIESAKKQFSSKDDLINKIKTTGSQQTN